MKKLNKLIVFGLILLVCSSNFSVQALSQEISIDKTTASLSTEETTDQPLKEVAVDSSAEIAATTDITKENHPSNTTSNEEATADSSSNVIDSEKIENQTIQQDSNSFLSVSSTEQLKDYLSEGRKFFRLMNDIDLGTTELQLSDGVIIDGSNFRMSYDKSNNYKAGLYVEESNATVTIMNTKFGNMDGNGVKGEYGIITGSPLADNITIIFENIKYISNNGQPLYNPHGSFILKGTNEFFQAGAGEYDQEWAETNYVEISSGLTRVLHQTERKDGFIYSHSSNEGNPYRDSAQVIVRQDATFNVKTNHAFLCNSDFFFQNIKVEKNGNLNLMQTETENPIRKRFIYPDLTSSAFLTFEIENNANVKLELQLPIQIKGANGHFYANQGSTLYMSIVSGPMFDINNYNEFPLFLYDVKKAEFIGTELGTMGLKSKSQNTRNLFVLATNGTQIESYHDQVLMGTFGVKKTILNVSGYLYKNIEGEEISDEGLLALGASKHLVFTADLLPKILETKVDNITADSAKLSVKSENSGQSIKEVKYLLFSSLEDTGTLEKAKHIENVRDFNGQETSGSYTTEYVINGLNPNTNYWLQTKVTNQKGQTEFSSPVAFSTQPFLNKIELERTTSSSTTFFGVLACDRGFWTDFTNGEENPVKGKNAQYGGIYKDVILEYSESNEFISYQSIIPSLDGNKNQVFYGKLEELKPNTTYYIRVRVTGVAGEQFILTETPITTFTTEAEKIIDVDIPIEIAFQTKNKDLTTSDIGKVYSKKNDYTVVNKGTVPVNIMLSNFQLKNDDARAISLVPEAYNQLGVNELNLNLLGAGESITETNLSENVQTNPVVIGSIDAINQKSLALDFSGKFFNPLGPMLTPKYQMTLRFEPLE